MYINFEKHISDIEIEKLTDQFCGGYFRPRSKKSSTTKTPTDIQLKFKIY